MVSVKEIVDAVKPFGYAVTGSWLRDDKGEELQYCGHGQVVRLFCPKRLSDLLLADVLKQILTAQEFEQWLNTAKSYTLQKERGLG